MIESQKRVFIAGILLTILLHHADVQVVLAYVYMETFCVSFI